MMLQHWDQAISNPFKHKVTVREVAGRVVLDEVGCKAAAFGVISTAVGVIIRSHAWEETGK